MAQTSPVFVSTAAAEAVFRWGDAVRSLQAVYANDFTDAASPRRTVTRDAGGWMRVLPAMPPGARYFGAKLMGQSNSAARPGAQFVTVLFDRTTSAIAGFVDSAVVTGYRTAATSAAALDRMAPRTPHRLAVYGSGLEAAMHVRAFAAVRQLEDVAVFSPTAERCAAFAANMAKELGIRCRAVTRAEDAVDQATIVLTAARSRGEKPILYGDWLKPGTTIVSIGSTVPEQREVDVSVLDKVDLMVCDVVDEVLDETGDLIAAAAAGGSMRQKAVSLGALMQGALDHRLAQARMPLFKSVGGGLQDVVVAELILTRALEAGLATSLPMEFETRRR